MIIKYLVLGKLTAKLYKANNNGCKQAKEILEHEAHKILMVNVYITLSERSYNTLSRIIKKMLCLTENETLFREIVQNDNNVLDDEGNEIVDNILLETEKEVNNKMTIEEIMSKVSNYKNFKPEYN
jgi:uncharacterized protein (UPF0297 family)